MEREGGQKEEGQCKLSQDNDLLSMAALPTETFIGCFYFVCFKLNKKRETLTSVLQPPRNDH